MRLYRDEELVALVTRYGYETPWATGTVEYSDSDRGERSARAAQFLVWRAENEDDLPDDDDAYDELCSREMARCSVTQADVDWCESGDWTIRTQDGIDHAAFSLDFIGDHGIQWRW
ncbi:hypothetical protein [Nocardia sp. R6R-6]|uniref:hypothetical protein n=1 Tax=Nocardia sp. R6R-6 TaxID=3459303 RepID=UPI00403DEA12